MSDETTIIFPQDPNLPGYRKKIIENYPTLRDNFAMAALTGLAVNGQGMAHEVMAKMSYEIADQMLKERDVKK